MDPLQGNSNPTLQHIEPEPPPTVKRDVPLSFGLEDDAAYDVTRDGARPRPDGPFSAPNQLGDYELLEEVARGGMGIVYKARHATLQRIVALKMILHGQLAGNDNVNRFQLEATATAQLQHHGIVSIYEISKDSEYPFFAMEFVDGISLAQRLEDGPLPSRQAAIYIEKVARAVHYAHSRGILHRDLKPANILLDEHDNPKVTDFGLAKIIEKDSKQTRTGAVMGTPSYMAPEQTHDSSKNLTPAVDVYSLGAILYELLTGRPPFQGESALATMHMVTSQEPVAPRLLNPKVDRDLETICLKCLEKEPGRRYASAEQLAQDLDNYLNSHPLIARRVGAIGRAVKWCRRKPAAAALITVCVASLVLFAAGMAVFAMQEKSRRNDAERSEAIANQQRREADLQKEKAELQSRLLNRETNKLNSMLYVAQIHLAQNAWESANIQIALDLLKKCKDHKLNREDGQPPMDLHGWEWHYLMGLCRGGVVLTPHGNDTKDAVSPFVLSVTYNGQGVLASGSTDGIIRLWRNNEAEPFQLLKGHESPVGIVRFHPDGFRLVSAGTALVTKRVKDELTGMEVDKKIPELFLWDLRKPPGEQCTPLEGLTSPARCIAFDPLLTNSMAVGSEKDRAGLVQIWDTDNWTQSSFPVSGVGPVTAIAYRNNQLPDLSIHIAVAISEGRSGSNVLMLEISDPDKIGFKLHHPKEVTCMQFIDGDRLITGCVDHRARLWEPRRDHSNPIRIFRGHSREIRDLAINREQNQLFTASDDRTVRVWEITTGSESLPPFRGHERYVHSLALHPSNRILASASRDGTIRLWDTVNGQESHRIEEYHRVEQVLFNKKDGSQLAVIKNLESDGGDQRIRGVCSIKTFRERQPLAFQINVNSRIHAADFSHDGQWIALACEDGNIYVYRPTLRNQRPQHILKAGAPVTALAFHPQNSILVSGGKDCVITIWDTSDPKNFKRIGVLKDDQHQHNGSVIRLAFNPHDGRQLASVSDGNQRVFLWNFSERSFQRVIVPSDGGTDVTCIAFHPLGQYLATGDWEGQVRLWDLTSDKVKPEDETPLSGHSDFIHSIAFSPDGRRLVSSSRDRTIRIWDLLMRQELLKLETPEGPTESVVFSPDRQYLVTGGADKLVRIWGIPGSRLPR